jgi:branched-chain amino acid transport system ATP-binding protein
MSLSPAMIAVLGGGVVRTFQVPALVNSLTVLDHLLIAQNAPGGESAEADALRPSRTIRLSAEVDEMVSRVNFRDKLSTPTTTLSFGERRIVANLCSCIRPAKIMLLDEPFANLSIAAVEGMKEILRRLATVEGRLIVMTEHHPRYVAGFASRFMQVHEKNLKELPVQQTTESAVREMLVKQKIDYD